MSSKRIELILKNFTSFPLNLKHIQENLGRLCQEIESQIQDLSIIFVNEEEIRRLNKKYRQKDEETDVLSFNLGDKRGEVFINPFFRRIIKDKNKAKQKREIFILIIHGVLHLMGFKHKNQKEKLEMENKAQELLKRCKL